MNSVVKTVAVVDYGMGNLRSVSQAVQAAAQGTGGAMPDCMRELRDSGLRESVLEAAAAKPLFGVCVGMQMLLTHSAEGDTPGLDLIPGEVVKFDLAGRLQAEPEPLLFRAQLFCPAHGRTPLRGRDRLRRRVCIGHCAR